MLLLTTLGVYIGLLMAGAAPGVVAQQAAAMTRNFELSEEVEVKDDLDNKPDDDAIVRSIRAWVRDLDKYLSDVTESGKPISLEWVTSDRPDNWDHLMLPRLGETNSGKYAWHLSSNDIRNVKSFGIQFDILKVSYVPSGDFVFSFAINCASANQATDLFRNLDRVFKKVATADLNSRQTVLWKNTQLTRSDSNVLIVTNLPRASIDQLIANDAD